MVVLAFFIIIENKLNLEISTSMVSCEVGFPAENPLKLLYIRK